MDNSPKVNIIKDKKKLKECEGLFRLYLDCVIHDSSSEIKNNCKHLETSLEKKCFVPKKWFQKPIVKEF